MLILQATCCKSALSFVWKNKETLIGWCHYVLVQGYFEFNSIPKIIITVTTKKTLKRPTKKRLERTNVVGNVGPPIVDVLTTITNHQIENFGGTEGRCFVHFLPVKVAFFSYFLVAKILCIETSPCVTSFLTLTALKVTLHNFKFQCSLYHRSVRA